jgi:imidazolonepropionase-like amidohydrolase
MIDSLLSVSKRTVGTIERNKAADLVLLDANPLDDIHNTHRISAVIIRGQVTAHYPHDPIIVQKQG